MSRRPAASIVASPVLVGAVTVLVTIVAVFLAYNANSGLPFVPTYDVSAQIPGGANLVVGNDVRIGGFRVGLVEEIRPEVVEVDGKPRSVAVIDMKLDRVADPLPLDSTVIVRPRSALGLKYVEITPGRSEEGYEPGGTVPLANSRARVEFDDVLNTFSAETRTDARVATEGFGDALAGRGASLNEAIQEFRPFFGHLQPVMERLSDPRTELDEFFASLNRAAGEAAPVAAVQAQLFTDMADTFQAFSACPECLRQTIEKSPPTTETAIRSFRVQRPFLAEFATLSRKLRPAARILPGALPTINSALRTGQPVLRRSVSFNDQQRRVFAALDDLAENPNTLLSLKDLDATLTVTTPLLEFITPYQTVCNYWVYFWGGLSEHLSATVPGGTYQRQLLNSTSAGSGAGPLRAQDNRVNTFEADRPADVPSNRDPISDTDDAGDYLQALHGQVVGPAIDSQGNADCQSGQTGYLAGLAVGVA
ncbi:MAG TPA: MlaD family protein, partial [Thermoleophilaceae bacterium]|nr:MlaD family protein [Thermoleophilaceae bacterium]